MSFCKPSNRRRNEPRFSHAHCKQGVELATPVDDDRYPGSFFRIPSVPKPGKTTWGINR